MGSLRGALVGLLLAGFGLSAGCGIGKTEVTVLADPRFEAALGPIVEQYEATHDDVRIAVSYIDPDDVDDHDAVEKLVETADIDLLLSKISLVPDEVPEDVDDFADLDLGEVVASDELVLAVPDADPGGLTAFEDLDRPEVAWAQCDQSLPCGAGAYELLHYSGINTEPAENLPSEADVLAAVLDGTVEAGLVSSSLAVQADGVAVLPIPYSSSQAQSYRSQVTTEDAESDEAREADGFRDALGRDAASAELEKAGFVPVED